MNHIWICYIPRIAEKIENYKVAEVLIVWVTQCWGRTVFFLTFYALYQCARTHPDSTLCSMVLLACFGQTVQSWTGGNHEDGVLASHL